MKFRQRLSIYLSILIMFIYFLSGFSCLSVKADGVGSGWNSVSNVVVPTSFGDFTVGQGYNYISTFGGETLPSGINFYFSYAEGKCYNITFDKVCTSVLNAKIGLTMSETTLTGWLSAVLNYASNFGMNILNAPAWAVPCPLKPCVTYNSANDTYSLVGFALTPLDGCVYSIPPSGTDPTIDIPSNFTNWVKEFTDNYVDEEGLNAPDYINIGTITENLAKQYVSYNESTYDETLNIIENPVADFEFGYIAYNNPYHGGHFQNAYNRQQYDKFLYFENADNLVFYASSESGFNSFVTNFGLSYENNALSIQDILSNSNMSPSFSIKASLGTTRVSCKYYNVSDGTVSDGGYNLTFPCINYYSGYTTSSNEILVPFSNKGFITVYKTNNTPVDIGNNVYSKPFYISNNYVNYNSSADNSLNTKVSNINNSVTNNTNIYNSSKTETNTNITNNKYQIDNSVNDNSVTTIINNYYGSSGSDPDPDPDSDDNGIWDRLLDAIADLVSKIGDIIVAIATGLIDALAKVIEAIANITTNFTAITDFFTQFFSFIPTEIMAPITLGVTLMIFICLVKALKG